MTPSCHREKDRGSRRGHHGHGPDRGVNKGPPSCSTQRDPAMATHPRNQSSKLGPHVLGQNGSYSRPGRFRAWEAEGHLACRGCQRPAWGLPGQSQAHGHP